MQVTKHRDFPSTMSAKKQTSLYKTTNNFGNFHNDEKSDTKNYLNLSSSKPQSSTSHSSSVQNNLSQSLQITPSKSPGNFNSTFPMNSSSSNVKVICRFRPLNEKEKQNTKEMCIAYIDEEQVEIKSKNEYNNFTFQFDKIFGTISTQKEIYDYSAKELVESVLAGYNATIFAYGQTASGKTYTMEGELNSPEKEGIIPRMVRHVFHNIMLSDSDIEYTVKVSIIEIYMEKIRDLIDSSKTNLSIREKDKEIYIEDLSEHYVSSEEDVLELIKIGSDNRTTAATNMNENSSRSHTLVIMTLHQKNTKTLEAKTGKLYLVDLAGSEKIAKTGSSGITLEEAKIINKSLSTLGMVINALTDGKSVHVPYRESKLTRVLTESLGGNAKTCLIITCSPSQYNESETLSTLRFGTRAKKIKNKPKINKEVTVPELKLHISKLEKMIVVFNNRILQLESYIQKNNLPVPTGENEEYENNQNSQLAVEEESNGNINIKFEEINKKYAGAMMKLEGEKNGLREKYDEAVMKIADLQAIIDQKEKIEEEFETKERQYKDTIKSLSGNLENIQYRESIKKNLKIIDKKTLDELYSQFRAHLTSGAKSKNINKDFANKVCESLSKIINDNFNNEVITLEEKGKLNARLKVETTNKLELFSNGKVVDYKEMNENYILSNITNEALLKSISEKNERIARLESDVKEYKEKLDLFEKQLTPDEKNLHKKIYTLEKNLEQVNNMYHQVVTQKSVLKIENQIFEKKLKKRNEKICTLVKENYGLVEQLKMRDDKISYYQRNKNIAIPQVVKVLRGSGKQPNLNGNECNNDIKDNM